MSASNALEQNLLSLKLTPVSIRELLFVKTAPCDIYGIKDRLYELIIRRNTRISVDLIKKLIEEGQARLYVLKEERVSFIQNIQEDLQKISRSISMGDPKEKGKEFLDLITIHLGYLYEDPTNDSVLKLQLQSIKNLSTFLLNNLELHEYFYQKFISQRHYFIFAQPLLSSLFLLGLLKQAHLFSNKEIENLFITSYFKDIGMSSIPAEKYDMEELSDLDKDLLANHANHSVQILNGRIPLSPSQQKIIKNHHIFSLLSKNYDSDKDTVIIGFETMIVSVMDIIAAMITERPYRASTSLYTSLDLIKVIISDQYPQEFRLIVSYFRNFFKNS